MSLECDTMTEEQNETKNENPTEQLATETVVPSVRDQLNGVLSKLQNLPVRCVNIIYIPETGELLLNHTLGMPRHEIVGLMEAVRDETKK